MPEYLSPGVYVEEISVGPKPIEGVATSNLGIVGPTERGPTAVRLVSSWLEFQRLYGDPIAGSHMARAVRGFFDNGGRRCFVARVARPSNAVATTTLDDLTIQAIGPGGWGGRISVRIATPSLPGDDDGQFKVIVLYYRESNPDTIVDPTASGAHLEVGYVEPAVLEVYDDLTAREGAQNEVVRALNASNLVRAQWTGTDRAVPDPSDDFTTLAAGAADEPVEMGDYTTTTLSTGLRNGQGVSFATGLLGLERIDEVSILAAPDEHGDGLGGLRQAVITQCETLRDRFAVFSVGSDERDVTAITKDPPSKYAALYWPWIRVLDPRTNDEVVMPPVGHLAGIMARTDIERGVHKPPANAVVRGAVDLEFPVTRAQQAVLNPQGINVIRDFRPDGRGIRLWGARTMSADPEWKYVNVRRLFLFLEESIEEGTQWVVFEPNSEALWDRVRRSIENFLLTVWRNGALMGTSAEQAFYVKCDRSTMTQDDIDNGRLICYIGVAPVKPAEFVIFRIHQWALGAKTAV